MALRLGGVEANLVKYEEGAQRGGPGGKLTGPLHRVVPNRRSFRPAGGKAVRDGAVAGWPQGPATRGSGGALAHRLIVGLTLNGEGRGRSSIWQRQSMSRAMYRTTHRALLKILPTKAPGRTQGEMFEAALPYLPSDLFPGGAKAGWWAKTAPPDQEAKGRFIREQTRPLRWRRLP